MGEYLAAIIGNPVDHSLSPQIHLQFAEENRVNLEFIKLCPPLSDFKRYAVDFFMQRGVGLSITAPFKIEAFQLADHVSTYAEFAGSANGLKIKDGLFHATNTDGIGLVRDLKQNKGHSLKNQKILIVGAGGAVAGIVPALIQEEPQSIILANRTLAKAEMLKNKAQSFNAIKAVTFNQLPQLGPVDYLFYGLSVDLTQEQQTLLKPVIDPEKTICYDLNYGSRLPAFLNTIKQFQVKCFYDGLGMLVEQAAELFHFWLGIQPKTEKVYQALLKKF